MSERYTVLQRLFHWGMAVTVLGGLAAGLTIGYYDFAGLKENFGMPVTNAIYEYHKTLGLLTFALLLVRGPLALLYGKPRYNPPITVFERVASITVHALLYAALFLMPIFGWLATDISDYPVEFFNWNLPQFFTKNKELGEFLYDMHRAIGWILAALVALHIAAALKHWLINRDGVMRRMSLF